MENTQIFDPTTRFFLPVAPAAGAFLTCRRQFFVNNPQLPSMLPIGVWCFATAPFVFVKVVNG